MNDCHTPVLPCPICEILALPPASRQETPGEFLSRYIETCH